MTKEQENTIDISEEVVEKPARNRWVTGVALILIGILALLGQFVNLPSMGQLILPLLGLIFILWGVFTRSSGLLIPGGILTGIGAGVYLMDIFDFRGIDDGGIFLVAFGGGFALITLLSTIFTSEKHLWALIPGAILAAIGGAILVGGAALVVLEQIGKFWPVLLIAAGIYVLLKRR